MKKGRALTEVLEEVARVSKAKEDFIVDTRALEFKHGVYGEAGEPDFYLQTPDREFGIEEAAHWQISSAITIPTKYYNRMRREAPDLLQQNVNHWFQNNPLRRMVRTVGNDARAFLSDRYRRLDNDDLVQALLPTLNSLTGISLESCEVTPSRLYIKAVTADLVGDIGTAQKNDIIYGGIAISNSEIGHGSLRIEPLIFRLVCENGLIVPEHGMKKYHIGRIHESDGLLSKLSDEALEADDRAFWLKARDVIHAVLQEDVFQGIVERMKNAGKEPVQDPFTTVEKLGKRQGFSVEEQKSVLSNLLGHEEPTKLGLSNAVTRAAQEVESYDRATEMEYMGAEILFMPQREWKEIVAA